MHETQLKKIERRLQSVKGVPPQNIMFVPRTNRMAERSPTYIFALAFTPDGKEFKCVVTNLSELGAGISMAGIELLPVKFVLAIDGYSAPTNARLVWREMDEGGIEFLKGLQ